MVRNQRWTRTSICFKWSEKRKQIHPKGWFISDLPWQKAKENFTPQKIQVCNIPSLPTSSKYLVSRCWDPLKVFSGGICGSKHLLRRYLEDLTRVCIDENHVNVNINTAVIYQQMCRTAMCVMDVQQLGILETKHCRYCRTTTTSWDQASEDQRLPGRTKKHMCHIVHVSHFNPKEMMGNKRILQYVQ